MDFSPDLSLIERSHLIVYFVNSFDDIILLILLLTLTTVEAIIAYTIRFSSPLVITRL